MVCCSVLWGEDHQERTATPQTQSYPTDLFCFSFFNKKRIQIWNFWWLKMQISYFRVIFTAKNMFQRPIWLFTHPYFIKNSSMMSREKSEGLTLLGKYTLRYHFVSDTWNIRIFLLFCFCLKAIEQIWNPDKIMPAQPCTDTKRLWSSLSLITVLWT